MSTTIQPVPAAPTTAGPKPTGSARPPTPVNPTAQPGPKAPATSIPPTTKSPAKPSAAPAPAEPPVPSNPTPPPMSADWRASLKSAFSDAAPAEPKAEATPTAPAEPAVAAPEAKAEPAAPETKAEAKAEPAAQAKADPFGEIQEPANLSEKGKQGWAALKATAKAEIDAARVELDAARAQLDTLKKATPVEMADIAEKDKALKDALDRLAVLDLERHPDFTKQYIEPQTRALTEAKQLLADSSLPEADFGKLLSLPRAEFAKQVSELAAKMPAFDQQTFVQNMRDAYKLGGDAKVALAKAGELKAGIEAKTAAQQKQAFEATWGKFGGAENFLKPAEIPDNAPATEKAELSAYNQALQSVRTNAEKNAFGRLDAASAATIASKAAVLDFVVTTAIPRMNREYTQLVADHKRLLAEYEAVKGAKNPGSFTAPQENHGDAGLTSKEIAARELKLAFQK